MASASLWLHSHEASSPQFANFFPKPLLSSLSALRLYVKTFLMSASASACHHQCDGEAGGTTRRPSASGTGTWMLCAFLPVCACPQWAYACLGRVVAFNSFDPQSAAVLMKAYGRNNEIMATVCQNDKSPTRGKIKKKDINAFRCHPDAQRAPVSCKNLCTPEALADVCAGRGSGMGQCSRRSHDTLENKRKDERKSLHPGSYSLKCSLESQEDKTTKTINTNTRATDLLRTQDPMSPGAVLPVVHSLAADSTSPETDALDLSFRRVSVPFMSNKGRDKCCTTTTTNNNNNTTNTTTTAAAADDDSTNQQQQQQLLLLLFLLPSTRSSTSTSTTY